MCVGWFVCVCGCVSTAMSMHGSRACVVRVRTSRRLVKENPDLMAGGMSAHCGTLQDMEEVTEAISEVQHLPMETMCQYKYLLQLDGNTASGRFPYLMQTGATIFKQVGTSPLCGYPRGWDVDAIC